MLPYIHIWGLKLPTYGLLMLLGAALSITFACMRAKKRNLEKIDVFLAAIFAFLCGLLGAKLLYIITDIPNMIAHFADYGFSMTWLLQRMAKAGIVFYGGLIGGLFGGYIYLRFFDLDFWEHADTIIPFLPLAHGLGRVGCFCAGCCYGREMDPPWGIAFTNSIGGAPNGVPLLPVQLIEAGFDIIILMPALLIFSRKTRRPGQVVGLYLICYGVFRFFNEYLRYDEVRGIWLGISTSQWISLILIPVGILLLSGIGAKYLASRRNSDGAQMCRPEDCPSCEHLDQCGGIVSKEISKSHEDADED